MQFTYLMKPLNQNKMKEIKCTKCGEEAYTYKEFVSGKCRFCGDELEDDIEYDSTARDMGMDSEL